ncbi:MAG: hypothetical protein KC502_13255 [Myxococcales bacterium]|nr:hypothetical protein [Myxococcales bacterium]
MQWRQLTERDASIAEQAVSGAVLFGRDDCVALVATGKHRTRFLHAVTTQKVDTLTDGARVRNTLCTAKGAVIGWWWQHTEPKRDVLWTARNGAESLAAALLAYRVAERVKIAVDEELTLIELIGPKAGEIAAQLGLEIPAEGATAQQWQGHELRIWPTTIGELTGCGVQLSRSALGELAGALIAAGATSGSFSAYEVLRIRGGIPRIASDSVDGSTPLELGLADAVHLEKGCYLGHEALAMQSWRGQLRRHLTWLTPQGDATPTIGHRLRTTAGRRAGWLGSGYGLPSGEQLGLALVQRRAIEAALVTEGDELPMVNKGTTLPGVFGE